MTAVAERHPIVADYDTFEAGLAVQPPELIALRRQGLARFETAGFPSTHEEEWRFTNVAPIAKEPFLIDVAAAQRAEVALAADRLAPYLIPDTYDLVFVNGHFSPRLSCSDPLPAGVFAGSLARALVDRPADVLAHLGRHADLKHPFVALNTAHVHDGACLLVPRGVRLERPFHLLFLTTSLDAAVVAYPRNLVVIGESAEATVVESYVGATGDRYFSCPVTEVVGLANSVTDHYRLGEESTSAFHMGTLKIHLERDTNFFTHSVSHGGLLVRNDIQAYLGGEGIHCTLNGLYLGRDNQLVDHHMWIDHAKPHCHSFELFKGILEGRSRAVFNGRIKVHQDAQKTDAKQSSQHLLLSDSAIAHSNPQLEIFADDVKCTHGSTTGHLDEEAIFYLRSRGIGQEAARSLLTYAFAAEVLSEIRLESVRKGLEDFLFTRLPKGDVVRQAV